METIFFATFETASEMSDRRKYYKEEKSLQSFHNWIEEMRETIIKDTGNENCIVKNIQFIQKKK